MAPIALIWWLLLILALVLYLVKKKYSYWSARGVSFVRPKFPFGNLQGPNFSSSLGEQMRDIYSALKGKGSVGGLYFFISPNCVLLDLDLIRLSLTSDFEYFPSRGVYVNTKTDPLSANLFTVDGEMWRDQRTKFSPAFSSGKIKMMHSTFLHVAERFRDNLIPMAEMQKPVDMKELCTQFTTDIIGHIALGLEFNAIQNPEGEFNTFGRSLFRLSRMDRFKRSFTITFPKLAKKLNIRLRDKSETEFYMNMIQKTIQHREENNIRRNDFLQLLMEIRNSGHLEGKGEQMTLEELAAQTFLFFIAGFETSASTMAFAAYELALNEELQERARKEIREVLSRHGGELTYEASLELKFLDQIIYETLRKYPVAPLLRRKVAKPYQVPGTDIVLEEDMTVWTSIMGIHHDPEIYPEPEKFDPSRFTKANIASRHPYAYLPFGQGQRVCLGMRFGMLQMQVGLATFLNNYKVKPSEKTMIPVKFNPNGLLLAPQGGLFLRIENAG